MSNKIICIDCEKEREPACEKGDLCDSCKEKTINNSDSK